MYKVARAKCGCYALNRMVVVYGSHRILAVYSWRLCSVGAYAKPTLRHSIGLELRNVSPSSNQDYRGFLDLLYLWRSLRRAFQQWILPLR